MTDRDIMKQALEALESCGEDEWYNDDDFGMVQTYDEEKIMSAITALRDRLAQPEQDAVLVEREACAKVCDLETALWEENSDGQVSLRCVAAVIRARGNT